MFIEIEQEGEGWYWKLTLPSGKTVERVSVRWEEMWKSIYSYCNHFPVIELTRAA